jgi:3-phenylpropionate/trans-cinnamate dioxygenase ferredoxin reductase component
MNKIVIVGASLAGAKAAETLREQGYDGELVLLGAEPERPYERPPLSKEYLRNEAGREKVYVHEENFYEANEIDLRLRTSVAAIDMGAREAVLEAGGRLPFDKLLLATGAAPRRLTVPGHDLDGIHYLRDLEDSDLLRERFEQGGHLVVIGAGWIGAEMAASARQKGVDVTLVEMTEVPLERVLGRELGQIYRDIHADHGVDFRGGVGVERFEGAERVERVVLADGSSIDCDFVGVGVGVVPRTQVAQTSGIAVDDGVAVNELLEAPGSAGVFAAGDVANAWHPLVRRRIRVEHWANALNQGPAAARNMLGAEQPYDRVPYFFSDQYDVGMEYSGFPTDWDQVVFRGDVAAREFIAFWLQEDRVVAGMNVNVWDVTGPIQELVRSGRPVDRSRLVDTDVPLEEIAGALAG